MNPLQLIPAKVRQYLYVAYGVAGLVTGGAAAYFAAVGHDVPDWTVGVGGVIAFLAPVFGVTAASNVQEHPAAEDPALAQHPGEPDELAGVELGEHRDEA